MAKPIQYCKVKKNNNNNKKIKFLCNTKQNCQENSLEEEQ